MTLLSPIWAVTCLYGIAPNSRRLQNYFSLRRALPIPVVAVELSFDKTTLLEPNDADILIQLTDGDPMWQKERLLNLAMSRLPASCRYVAWLDADIMLRGADWPATTCRLLEDYPVAQLFDRALDAPRNVSADQVTPVNAESVSRSLAARWRDDDLGDALRVREGTRVARDCASGMAWAARRGLLDDHGLYDVCIAGAGDRAINAALLGRFDDAVHALRMTDAFESHYLQWAQSVYESVRGRVGCLSGDVVHLWHGPPANRVHQQQRHVVMNEQAFDPSRDITLKHDGTWCFASNKPGLHEFFPKYFAQRNSEAE